MKIELEQECDYQREAECARIMRKFLRGYPDYYVPRVIDDLSGNQVFTQEFIHGLTIDECATLDQDTRNNIVKSFLVLLFTELLQFRYMQTDPNWANFLYNPETKQVDFFYLRNLKNSFISLSDSWVYWILEQRESTRKSLLRIILWCSTRLRIMTRMWSWTIPSSWDF